MYTSPDQAPRSFGEAPRQPLTGPMTDQDPTSTTHQQRDACDPCPVSVKAHCADSP